MNYDGILYLYWYKNVMMCLQRYTSAEKSVFSSQINAIIESHLIRSTDRPRAATAALLYEIIMIRHY